MHFALKKRSIRRRSVFRHRFWRRLALIPATLLILMTFSVGVVEAADGMRGDECQVHRNDYIEHDFYFFCNTLTIHGTIEGDLIGVASRVTVARTAQVTGDIWVFGGKLLVQGTVGDDIRFGGAAIEITEQTRFTNPRADVTVAAIELLAAPDSLIPGDVLMYGIQAEILGDVGGNIDFQGQILVLDGSEVQGNVDAIVGDSRAEVSFSSIPIYSISLRRNYGLYINSEARIAGNLRYEAPRPATIPRNTVTGETVYKQVLQQDDITSAEPETFVSIMQAYIVNVLQDTISLMIVGLLALRFIPTLVVESGTRTRRAFIPAFSWGFVLFILFFPLFLLSVSLSLLTVMLTTFVTFGSLTVIVFILLVIMNSSFVAGAALLFFYLGRVVVCFVFGYVVIQAGRRYLAKRQSDPDGPPVFISPLERRFHWIALLLGVMLFSVTLNLPLPSPIPTFELMLEATVAFTGLGAVFMYARDFWFLGGAPVIRRQLITPGARLSAPPPEEPEAPTGMDNLPEGFRGFPD